MIFDYSKLIRKIWEMTGTKYKFSKKIEIPHLILYLKLNNLLEFTQEEIINSMIILEISSLEVSEYFFKEKV